MPLKSISLSDLNKAITSDDMLGKDVIDAEGVFIGVAEKAFIDPDTIEFVGIAVDKGFLRKGLVIGKEYIERIAEHAIFLNIRIAYEIRGMHVFDVNGKELGTIKDLVLTSSGKAIQSILVNSGTKLPHKEYNISAKDIENIGYTVRLNITQAYLLDKANKSPS